MAAKDHQFSIRFFTMAVALFATYLGLARRLFEPAVVALGLIFFLFWSVLSFFLLTRPPEFDPENHRRPGPKPSLRWRLVASCLFGMVVSLLAMLWATRRG